MDTTEDDAISEHGLRFVETISREVVPDAVWATHRYPAVPDRLLAEGREVLRNLLAKYHVTSHDAITMRWVFELQFCHARIRDWTDASAREKNET